MIVILCTALWLLHVMQLVRGSLRRTWPALCIALVALGVTIASYFVLDRGVAAVAAGIAAVFLIAPALATQAASRALKWGAIRRARALALGAFVVRPLPAQRVFRRAVEVAWRIDRGEPFDIERALEELGPLSPVERAVHSAAFLSWTNDFAGIVEALSDARARRFALRTGMGAILIVATGESSDPDALVTLHRELVESGAFMRQRADAAWALLALGAYLGEAELVREHAPEYAADAPRERMAFIIASAEQRAGDFVRARATVEAALAEPDLRPSTRARLLHRLEHPLAPIDDPRFFAIRLDLKQRLEALRTLAPLRIGMRRPAPVTMAVSFSLIPAFAVQHSLSDEVQMRFAVVAPFASAPEPYRLLTYAWLHLDGAHLFLNLVGLVVFGRFVERHFGAWRLLAIYLAGAVAGGAAFLWWGTQSGPAIGASGAVLALFGATVARIALDPAVRKSPQGKRELIFLASIALLQMVVDLFWPQSAGSAHAGGLLAGLLLGALLKK